MAIADLLTLQSNIKKDADGYKDEFMLQYRHYEAMLDIFNLKPSKESKEFGDLAMFLAQVSKCYPTLTETFPPQLVQLLDTHYAVMDPALRRSLVQALVILRNKGQMQPLELLTLMFKLFRCQDKALRDMLFKHIVTDIKVSNDKARNEKLNRQLQSFLYGILQDDNEMAAKKSLAVLTELWRRHVWRDARTVNVIATAAFHKSSRIMLAVMKFFLGQDDTGGGESDSDSDGEDTGKQAVAGPTKEEIYKAHHKGTKSSKKKKIAKLKRVMNTVRRSQKRQDVAHESFAALHLLHDPHSFAERLFSRLRGGNERFETRVAMMTVVSRVVGVHKLLLLNFYPFLQKYIQPHQRDVTVVLAALVQACHPLVPPETLQPVLRQLVDHFVHDKARPEVMTIGLKTVREMCLRTPLVMHQELLQDLALYKKFRDKEVATAARGVVNLFQELNPGMLAKKDRGRGADLTVAPRAYGEVDVKERVEGAELLQQALANGDLSDDEDNSELDSDDDEAAGAQSQEEGGSEDGAGSEGEQGEESESDEDEDGKEDGDEEGAGSEGEEGRDGVAAATKRKATRKASQRKGRKVVQQAGKGEGEDDGQSERESGSEADEDQEWESDDGVDDDGRSAGGDESDDGIEGDERPCKRSKSDLSEKKGQQGQAPKLQPQADSLSQLKKQLAAAVAKEASEGERPIEMDRLLTEEDFARIKRLRHKQMIDNAMAKHGLKSAARMKRLREAAEAEAEEAMELDNLRKKITEQKVNPDSLLGKHKRRKDKEERMQSVLAGREGRGEFGAASKFKRKKVGSLSEKEKQKRKQLPLAARLQQIGNRHRNNKMKHKGKNFKGHVRG